jgi:hypothetical protein
MDLSKFSTKKKSNEGAFLHLKSPVDGKPLFDGEVAVGLYLLGSDSDKVQAAIHKRINESVESKPKQDADVGPSERSDAAKNELLADCTQGWEGLSLDGDNEFSREKILSVYSNSGWLWLRNQALNFVDDRANFI